MSSVVVEWLEPSMAPSGQCSPPGPYTGSGTPKAIAGHRAGSERGTTCVTQHYNRINCSCWWVTRGSFLVYSPGVGGESDTIVLDGVECLPQDSRTWLGQGSELPAAAPVTMDLSQESRREEEGLQRWQRRVAV